MFQVQKHYEFGILHCFRDLRDWNMWRDNSKHLKDSQMKISISPDLPPKLRQLKTTLLNIGGKATQRSRRLAAPWGTWLYGPMLSYMFFGRADEIRPTTLKKTIVKQVLETEPLLKVVEPTY